MQTTAKMKTFNTAGTCRPNEHYMVDITDRLEIIGKMIAKGDYFCINRGRQYGKTTTLEAISTRFAEEYCVFSISFETIEEACYKDEESLYAKFVSLLAMSFAWTPLGSLDDEVGEIVRQCAKDHKNACSSEDLLYLISQICHINSKPIVLIIDEVDQAGNHQSFLKFLGLLRGMYLNRKRMPTFQSVILAGVYDVKNLKLKLRSDEQHQYNSPWNIAAPFDVDMSLPTEGIAGMLAEYKADRNLRFDEKAVAQTIRDYTSGYPFLVSRLCQIIDAEQWEWSNEGVLKAVNVILMERNTLFDNMVKKLSEYPELKTTLKRILMGGVREMYNPDEKHIQIATMFNYIQNNNGQVAMTCRIMETRLYNFFIAENKSDAMFQQGENDRGQFVHNGIIDMPHLLEKFVEHMRQTFSLDKDHKFLEENAREIFLTYLRPIINGVGNFYIEPQTRNHQRMDVVIDYLGNRYVVELKIWHGNAYNERGEEQLAGYLEYFNLQRGYLISFCFNKQKPAALLPPVTINGRELIEAIV